MQWALIGYGITIFALFLNFYINAYIRGKRLPPSEKLKAKKETNGVAMERNQNGVSANGDKKEKKKTK